MVQSLHLYIICIYTYIAYELNMLNKQNATTFLQKYHKICFSPRCLEAAPCPRFAKKLPRIAKETTSIHKTSDGPKLLEERRRFYLNRVNPAFAVKFEAGENWTGVLRSPLWN